MQHLPAHDVIEFLEDHSQTLARLQSRLATQVLEGGPTVSQHPGFIRDVIQVQEQRPRCQALLERLHAADSGNNAYPMLAEERHLLNTRIAEHLAMIRSEPTTLVAHLAKESVQMLLAFHAELESLMDGAIVV